MRRLLAALVALGTVATIGITGPARADSASGMVQTICKPTTPLYKDPQLATRDSWSPGWGAVFYEVGGDDKVVKVDGPISRYPGHTYYAERKCFRPRGQVQYTVSATCQPTTLYEDRALTTPAYSASAGDLFGYAGGDATVSEVAPELPVPVVEPTYFAPAGCFQRT